MALGVSLVAAGQGLVMNPDWVELARGELDERIDIALHPSKVPHLAIPGKLWKVIEAATGWFKLHAETPRAAAAEAEAGPSAWDARARGPAGGKDEGR